MAFFNDGDDLGLSEVGRAGERGEGNKHFDSDKVLHVGFPIGCSPCSQRYADKFEAGAGVAWENVALPSRRAVPAPAEG